MRTRHLIACGLAALSLAAAGCGNDESGSGASGEDIQDEPQEETVPQDPEPAPPADTGADRSKPKIEIPAGKPPARLKTEDVIEGKGAAAQAGQTLSVNYVGVSYSTGKEFDTSFGREPFQLQLGAGMVIPGWDQGLEGMKVGGRRKLTIPSELGYGPAGQPPDIKPNQTLVFVIDLLGAQ